MEAAVTYTLTIPSTAAGTHAYYSGTQGDLQVEMGLYGAIIVLPSAVPSACTSGIIHSKQLGGRKPTGLKPNSRLAAGLYNHPGACYDREIILPVLGDRSPGFTARRKNSPPGPALLGCNERCHRPTFRLFSMINRPGSMPDLMDPNYALNIPHQPYNGNPHASGRNWCLLRIIGTGRWQHPVHVHGNHVRVSGARWQFDSQRDQPSDLAGPLLFTHDNNSGPHDGWNLLLDQQKV